MRSLGPFRPLLIALVFLGLAPSLTAAAVVDQMFDPRDPTVGTPVLFVMYRGGYFAQTFTVGAAGRIVGADVLLSRREVMQYDLLYEISATLDGVPLPTMGLPAHGSVPFSMIPVDPIGAVGTSQDWVHLDLSAHDIVVTPGQVLAIVLKPDTGVWLPQDPEHQFDILWHGRNENPYAGGMVYAHPPLPGAAWNTATAPDAGFRTWVETVATIDVEVRPGEGTAAVNPHANGMLAVALLGDAEFDALQIDPASVRVGGEPVLALPNGRPMTASEDVDGDGRTDLVVHVQVAALDLVGDEVEILVTASTWAGVEVRGSDTVKLAP